jgi:hypothetical protein
MNESKTYNLFNNYYYSNNQIYDRLTLVETHLEKLLDREKYNTHNYTCFYRLCYNRNERIYIRETLEHDYYGLDYVKLMLNKLKANYELSNLEKQNVNKVIYILNLRILKTRHNCLEFKNKDAQIIDKFKFSKYVNNNVTWYTSDTLEKCSLKDCRKPQTKFTWNYENNNKEWVCIECYKMLNLKNN